MPFYVPVGRRGLVFRFGSLLTRVLGSFAYWRARHLRALVQPRLSIFSWPVPRGDESRSKVTDSAEV